MNVCYRVERDKAGNFIVHQQFEDRSLWMKLTASAMAWVHQQVDDEFKQKDRHDKLKGRAEQAKINKIKKEAEYLYGGNNVSHSN